MASLKKNVVYSSILTCAGYVFPLITYPYVSRVLGVTNIGTCNFVDSIINYFSLISMMGIGTIGVREIVACGNDINKRSKVFSNLFWLNGLATLIACIALLIAIFTVKQLYEYKELMFIGFVKLATSFLAIEWFFRGIENFKYITERSIIVKCIYVIAVFVFIHDKDDIIIYYFLSGVFITTINAFLNINYARKFVHLLKRGITFKPYLKSFFILGFYALLTSMYTTFNTAFLGFKGGSTEVGYYATAIKLFSIILSLYTAFTTVMMPRMSSLLAEGRTEEFREKLNTSNDLLMAFTLPLVIIGFIYAPEVISIISGKGYEGAIIPMRIIMPLVFIIGYEQILVIQTLMPLKKDKAIFINSVIGATIGIILNIILVPIYKSIGSSVVWLCSELSVFASAQYFVIKYTRIQFPLRKFGYFLLLSILPALLCIGIRYISNNILVRLSILFVDAIYYFYMYVYVAKIGLLRSILSKNHKIASFLRID